MSSQYQICEVTPREDYIPELLAIWEASVRASHDFLSEAAVKAIKAEVPGALMAVDDLVVVKAHTGQIAGFMGMAGENLEMLFLHPSYWGQGLGRALLEEGMTSYGISQLTVNEQNPKAVGFYQEMGFVPYNRTALDTEGRPYPLLYMHYQNEAEGRKE
ncbi:MULTISPECIES: GNAT family N-acetyltransferase [Aerococcus]|uniref:GNAT family N-acetyltransferase n=1 Tax=Aerococcus TaxID=1375 RepID=UPI0018A72B15|nr:MULTISPECIES: GNAT family N-acetyltransferase [Aerococcus]MCY3036330.1 GNAT family N-acetyltransferase [Aerococcus sp. Group 2]MCY3039636.1 GNAT family N-acetyltransferase [Aerococcus sp. Group 2]MCY3041842.1 GNAT family N-acetyltransferase [Aerococcus sp. Group 2]MCY3043092.1 GNAT family N-acetyltransferase [Aerococcus sp. Group 2]MDK6520344.1 GNAT family N-acetyltransferase [Aerococcus urinae]